MKFITRLFLVIILISCCAQTNAQWLNKTVSSDDLYKLAKRDIELKRYQRAINECRQGIEESPKNMDLHLLLGRAYSLAGKLDSARFELNKVKERNPRYRDVYIYLVNLEATACNYQQSIEYADEGLKYFPNDRDLLLKKMDMYNKKGEWAESDKMAAYLFEHYSNDPVVRSTFIEYKLSIARHYNATGYIEIAKRCYEAVLEQEPLNKEALDAIFTLDIKSGNYSQSLIAVNRALLSQPNSYELYMKKLGILTASYNYIEAIDILEKLEKLYPGNSEVIRLLSYTRLEAGRYYMKQDPLVQFEIVLDKDPNNEEALNYVINICFSRGLFTEALVYLNTALRRSPNNKDLLAKKQSIYESMENYGQASIVAETLFKGSPSPAAKEHLIELKSITARAYMADMEYDSAIVCLNSILALDHTNLQAIGYLINTYSAQKRYDDALHIIDDALKTYPDNEQLLYKKAGVLDAYQHFADAAKISKKLIDKQPKNKFYISAYVEQILSASRQSMQIEDYPATIGILRQALDMQPNNADALNYIINLELALKQYDSALYFVNLGLLYYPDSKDFTFKKSIVYAEWGKLKTAYSISGELYRDFPYNTKFKGTYTDQMLLSGRQYMNMGKMDSAIKEFNKVFLISPYDTSALFYTINILNDRGKYNQALVLVEKGRKYYPAHPYFLLKRAVILESMKRYDEAWRAMDTLSKLGPMDQKYIDYKDFLFSYTLRNEIGVFFLSSTFDPQTIVGDNSERRLATLQYTRKFDNASVTGRINYVGRITGSGYQFELEGTLYHTPKWYSWANIGYSNTTLVFPPIRFGYSLFHTFNKGYEGELGYRFVSLDSDKTYSGLASISKEWRDFYFTFRAYLTNMSHYDETKGPYSSYTLSTRYYVKEDHTNFFSVFMGYGLIPDDFSRLFQLNYQEVLYKTVSVGAGYQMKLHYRTTLSINYTWYNIQYNVNPDAYKNQYDLNLVLLHRF